MSRHAHPCGGSRRMRRAHLLAAAGTLSWETSQRLCERCFASGNAGGVEWVEEIRFTDRRTGEQRVKPASYAFVSRTCPECKGEGSIPVPTKRGRGWRR